MSERAVARSALGVDRMNASQTGARLGSRPQPPEAGARSASLEPGRSPGYLSTTQLLTPTLSPDGGKGLFWEGRHEVIE
jgi:hypothetical protein